MNRYITTVIIALTSAAAIQAQASGEAPKLIVNITIDQFRSDYMEQFTPLYGPDGFRRILQQGRVYELASYLFSPVNRAAAITTLTTGTTPDYHHIQNAQWLDRKTLRPVFCVEDNEDQTSPVHIATSTLGDEMKISTSGIAKVYSIAKDRECAVLSAGHGADGAFWINPKNNHWTTSTYYPESVQKWLNSYINYGNKGSNKEVISNKDIIQFTLDCITAHALGRDEVPDLLNITLSAENLSVTNWQTGQQKVYIELDRYIAQLINQTEKNIGKEKVLFVLTSTGYENENDIDYSKYRVPSGTIYINRTTNLLNMFLSAIYGQGKYVEACYHNDIYLNHKLIEQKKLSLTDILNQSRDFLLQNAGIHDATAHEANNSYYGDLSIEVAPGWKILNEETGENYRPHSAMIPFPIIFMGAGVKAERISLPVTTDRIAPTIAKCIRIRAPNACKSVPLF